jgi:hypothetical protein
MKINMKTIGIISHIILQLMIILLSICVWFIPCGLFLKAMVMTILLVGSIYNSAAFDEILCGRKE